MPILRKPFLRNDLNAMLLRLVGPDSERPSVSARVVATVPSLRAQQSGGMISVASVPEPGRVSTITSPASERANSAMMLRPSPISVALAAANPMPLSATDR